MSGSSAKRPAESAAQQRPAKITKIDTPAEKIPDAPIAKVENLNAIFVRDLDHHITKPNFGTGICSTWELQLAEASYMTSIIPPYQRYQLRMYEAQSKHSSTLLSHLATNMDRAVEVKRTMAAKAAKRLLPLASAKAIADRSDMKDAIMYRVAFLVAYHAYYTRSTAEVIKSYQELGEAIDCTDVSALVEELTAASERHLARPSDRSYLWQSQTMSVVPSLLAPASTTDFTSTGQSSVHSMDHIRDIARRYIKSLDDLKAEYDIIEWTSMGTLDMVTKERITRKQLARKIPRKNMKSAPTPPGMLLHGVGGCGKTEVALSWCQHLGATLITFDRSIQGSLAGHTEKAIKYLFEHAAELAETGPVVLFFDEADQLLAISPSNDSRSLHAAIKDYFSATLKSRGDIHVIAATNHPERIDMTDWNRRLQIKIHVEPPKQDGRLQILRSALEDHHHALDGNNMQKLTEELDGFTAHDILSIIEEAAACEERLCNTRWVEKNVDGKLMLCAAGKDVPSIVRSLEEMRESDIKRVKLPDLTMDMVLEVLEHGSNGNRMPRTYAEEELQRHRDWNTRVNSL